MRAAGKIDFSMFHFPEDAGYKKKPWIIFIRGIHGFSRFFLQQYNGSRFSD